jgi:carbamate kinase
VRIVVALGGNALLPRGGHPDAQAQVTRLAEAGPALARLAAGNEVVIVHGNGPQVGLLADESQNDPALVRPYPLSDLVAETQGLIGSWIQSALQQGGLTTEVAVLVTRTLVDAADPAFATPTKFIGLPYDEATARQHAQTLGWTVAQDGPQWRRVVPSPAPTSVPALAMAVHLLERNTTVVLAGGGGIPFVLHDGRPKFVEGVIDKDAAASLIAFQLQADLLLILTDVEGVMSGFGTTSARLLSTTSPDALGALSFPAGSMGPKVDSVRTFVEKSQKRAAIGSLDDLEAVAAGHSGTQVLPDKARATI